jgi:hypothetical protein
MSLPPSDYAYRLALMRAHGEYHRAAHILECLNRVQRCFGYPDYEMPEPLRTDLPDLVTCPAETRVREQVARDLTFTIADLKRKAA